MQSDTYQMQQSGKRWKFVQFIVTTATYMGSVADQFHRSALPTAAKQRGCLDAVYWSEGLVSTPLLRQRRRTLERRNWRETRTLIDKHEIFPRKRHGSCECASYGRVDFPSLRCSVAVPVPCLLLETGVPRAPNKMIRRII